MLKFALCLILTLANVAILTRPAFAEEPDKQYPKFTPEMQVRRGSAALATELSTKMKDRPATLFTLGGTDSNPTTAAITSAVQGPLTEVRLQQMLENLGYSPKVEPTLPKGNRFLVDVKRGDWTVTILLGLAADGQSLAVIVPLSGSIDPEKVPAARWQELLASNTELAPVGFAFVRQQKQLILYRADRNVDIRPAVLREILDKITDVTIATSSKWKDLETASISIGAPARPAP